MPDPRVRAKKVRRPGAHCPEVCRGLTPRSPLWGRPGTRSQGWVRAWSAPPLSRRSSRTRRTVSCSPLPSPARVRLRLVTTASSARSPPNPSTRSPVITRCRTGSTPADRRRRARPGRADRRGRASGGDPGAVAGPLGQVRDGLGIPGMGEAVALNVRDKARMKDVLRRARIALCQTPTHAPRGGGDRLPGPRPVFRSSPNLPDGAGAKATFRLDTPADFGNGWLAITTAHPGGVAARGVPHRSGALLTPATLRSHPVVLDRRLRAAAARVVRNPWMQWTVVLPRRHRWSRNMPRSSRVGPQAIDALGVTDAFSHMEWFARPDGTVAISEIGAPPGARQPDIGFAHDIGFLTCGPGSW